VGLNVNALAYGAFAHMLRAPQHDTPNLIFIRKSIFRTPVGDNTNSGEGYKNLMSIALLPCVKIKITIANISRMAIIIVILYLLFIVIV
jgi:hypothetical protein